MRDAGTVLLSQSPCLVQISFLDRVAHSDGVVLAHLIRFSGGLRRPGAVQSVTLRLENHTEKMDEFIVVRLGIYEV